MINSDAAIRRIRQVQPARRGERRGWGHQRPRFRSSCSVSNAPWTSTISQAMSSPHPVRSARQSKRSRNPRDETLIFPSPSIH
jgi:hypothetical protein